MEPRICAGCGYHLGSADRDGRPPSSVTSQKKDQILAACLSFLVPGLGQVYNGRLGRGCAIFGGTVLGLVLFLLPGVCVWGYGVWDGHRMAGDMNLGNIPYSPTPKAKMAIFGVLPLLVVLLAVSTMIGLPPDPLPMPAVCDNALVVPYDDLLRYNEDYVGKTVRFSGKIEQASKSPFSDNAYIFLIATKWREYLGYSSDVIRVNYQGLEYHEGDVIECCGVVRGLRDSTVIFGKSVMIPEIDASGVRLLKEKGAFG